MLLMKQEQKSINFQSSGASLQTIYFYHWLWGPSTFLYLVPLVNVRERFSACSFCLSASSSRASLCFSSAERAWPALTNDSGVCKIKTGHTENSSSGVPSALGERFSASNLVSEHEGDYFQYMHTPLLFTLSRREKLDQIIKTAHVNGPQHPVMYAGIIIHFLSPERRPRVRTLKRKAEIKL